MSKQTPKVFKSYSSRNGHVFFSRPIIPLCNLFRKFAILYALLTAAAVFCGGQDAVGSQGACADLSFCLDSRPPAERLEIGGAVAVVNRVSERCAVLVCFHVAAQNVVVVGILRLAVGRGGGGICTCAVCAAGPACVEAAGWLVLICEEGLVPPINTNSSDIVLAKFRQQTKWGQQGRKKWAAYFAIARQVNLQCFGVVLETKRSHGEQDVFSVYRLALFLLAFFRCWRDGGVSCCFLDKSRAGEKYLRW